MCIDLFEKNVENQIKGNNTLICRGYFKKSNCYGPIIQLDSNVIHTYFKPLIISPTLPHSLSIFINVQSLSFYCY